MGKVFFNSEEDLRSEALNLWRAHAANYRCLIEQYESLLKIKREKKIKLQMIKKHILEGYKPILYFQIKSEDSAASYLHSLSRGQLRILIYDIKENTRIGSSYYVIRNWIKESNELIKIQDSKKGHGYDPEYNRSYSPRPRAKRFQKKSIYDFDEDR